MSEQGRFGSWTAYAQFIQEPIVVRMADLLGREGKLESYTEEDLHRAYAEAIKQALDAAWLKAGLRPARRHLDRK